MEISEKLEQLKVGDYIKVFFAQNLFNYENIVEYGFNFYQEYENEYKIYDYDLNLICEINKPYDLKIILVQE